MLFYKTNSTSPNQPSPNPIRPLWKLVEASNICPSKDRFWDHRGQRLCSCHRRDAFNKSSAHYYHYYHYTTTTTILLNKQMFQFQSMDVKQRLGYHLSWDVFFCCFYRAKLYQQNISVFLRKNLLGFCRVLLGVTGLLSTYRKVSILLAFLWYTNRNNNNT